MGSMLQELDDACVWNFWRPDNIKVAIDPHNPDLHYSRTEASALVSAYAKPVPTSRPSTQTPPSTSSLITENCLARYAIASISEFECAKKNRAGFLDFEGMAEKPRREARRMGVGREP